MKKSHFSLAIAIALACTLTFSSCIGSFALTNKVLNWNKQIGSKFVNELVFVAFWILPVYEITGIADVLVINSIEFWSGSNPLASIGEVKKVEGENGTYLVETLKNGYSITKEGEESEALTLVYDESNRTWNVEADGVSSQLLKMNNDGTADLALANGETMTVALNAQGLIEAKAAMSAN